jgi:hypothetical protein
MLENGLDYIEGEPATLQCGAQLAALLARIARGMRSHPAFGCFPTSFVLCLNIYAGEGFVNDVGINPPAAQVGCDAAAAEPLA